MCWVAKLLSVQIGLQNHRIERGFCEADERFALEGIEAEAANVVRTDAR